MAHTVNLDALVPREDFEVTDVGAPASPIQAIQIRDLEPNTFFYPVVRKPDFQRETSDWSPNKISGFVRSFLDGDLIPALILWQSGKHIFLIDGAHRLSALVAWVQDDYGDGAASRAFFNSVIPDEQVEAAQFTRSLIKKEIGSYKDHQLAIQPGSKAKPELVDQAQRLASLAISLQWVKGDASKAEASFFKINQQATPIDKTELRLLQARTHANALTARALVRSGTGHKYWSRFDPQRRQEIEELARSIYEILFSPALKTPIRTLDLPVAGRGYSSQALPLVFEFVNLVNDVKNDASLGPDTDGKATVGFLQKCKHIASRLSGTQSSSLGLHPAVYFYSTTGRYQPTAFLAVVSLVKNLEARNRLRDFTKSRKAFEAFLVRNRLIVNQVTVKYGSAAKGFARLEQLLQLLVDLFASGMEEADVLKSIQALPEYSYLKLDEVDASTEGSDFSVSAKSAVFLRDALKDALRCGICGGYIHRNSIAIDHVKRKADGGTGAVENGQLTHPYCNGTIKN